MKNLKNYLVVVISITLVFTFACNKEDGPVFDNPGTPIITEFGEPIGQANEATIGSEGGTIQSSDGMLSLTIPQGALSSATVISIQPVTNQAPLGLGKGYRLGPEGLNFDNPVTLTFHYSEELLDSNPAEFLWIVFQEIDGSWKAMLNSALNSEAKTVTVETSHFSDWSIGRFVDLTLEPVSKSVKKGEKIELAVTGFSKGEVTAEDDLAPLIFSKIDPLDFLSTNELGWKVVEWTLNGVKTPVSNSNGSLKSTKLSASYTAPANVPKPNVVSISVELESSADIAGSSTFYLTSKITIYESDLYLKIEFRGQTYIYYQYGLDGSEIIDPENYSIVLCGLSENRLEVGAATYANFEAAETFQFYFDNPSEGSRAMIGLDDGGHDEMDFGILNPFAYYDMSEVTRTQSEDYCYFEKNESNLVTMTLTKYSGTLLSEVDGSFTGTLYYSDDSYEPECKSSTPYQVSGSFHLLLLIQ
jgi:hypothetical protein